MTNLDWTSLSHEELEREYSPSSCVVGGIGPLIEQYTTRSRAARDACAAAGLPVIEMRYGPAPTHTLDLVAPRSTGSLVPLIVFIHGGYWQELSKLESFFGAPDCLARGVAYAAVDYTLAPHATVGQIVEECRSALLAIFEAAPEYGVDQNRIFIAGSSAGAHLAAMATIRRSSSWRPAGLALLSGIYDLEPLVPTYINEALGFDSEMAKTLSPIRQELAGLPPTLIAYGENETIQFKRQSDTFADALASAGTPVTNIEVPGRNHFNIVFDLCDPQTPLGEALLSLVTT